MNRLTARVLLLFLFASAFAPVLQALSAAAPHACCLRRLRGPADRGSGFYDSARRDGNCCPPLTTSHSAQVVAGETAVYSARCSELELGCSGFWHGAGFDSSHSSRAPPSFS